jgi:hypothetical protein
MTVMTFEALPHSIILPCNFHVESFDCLIRSWTFRSRQGEVEHFPSNEFEVIDPKRSVVSHQSAVMLATVRISDFIIQREFRNKTNNPQIISIFPIQHENQTPTE